MADMAPVIETDGEFLAYWSDPRRVEPVGHYDWIEARRAYDDGRADLLLANSGTWLAYRVRDEFEMARRAVRAFTKRIQARLFSRSMA